MSLPPSDKDAVLARVREALRLPARIPHVEGSVSDTIPLLPSKREVTRWLPAVGPTFEERFALFAAQAAALKAEVIRVATPDDVPLCLAQLAKDEGWETSKPGAIAAHPGLHSQAVVEKAGFIPFLVVSGYDKAALEGCVAGVTACEALVAQTGSVLVTSKESGGRALTVLPPHHVVVATAAQLVPDLPAAFERLREVHGKALPSMISFITGPSRTGDIERILVLGAHGPKRLTILFVG
ncbi:L-lactate utilization protein LutC, contains LUD domain [Verrucomicrobium sp. GAS474]|uniref:LutC/YkgG family protein n=1 Tax=Verrucomicrobium sp. GAS474 TaxID=1882831 RepID=UPI00087D26B5|nr:lactate utilization protein [Verrucomicrobium sp. GAS474]SDT85958.1 L-lactate utilization protein LutC, contains LUD domain [Verrucomicrobium sp. GAS474]